IYRFSYFREIYLAMYHALISRIFKGEAKFLLRLFCILAFLITAFLITQFSLQNLPSKFFPHQQSTFKLTLNQDQPNFKKIQLDEVDWQEIREASTFHNATYNPRFFVYSAYLDVKQNVLRVISITPSFSRQKMYCHIFDEELQQIAVVPGNISTTKDGGGYKYSMAFILCKLDINPYLIESKLIIKKAKFVTMLPFSKGSNLNFTSGNMVSNLLSIPDPARQGIEEPHKFGACVQPTFNYDRVAAFLEWIEFQKMMGVTQFTFYNMSIGPRVSCVMKSAAINEDEYIVPNPTFARNYYKLISVLDEAWRNMSRSGVVAVYQFASAFFDPDFGQFDSSTLATEQIPRFSIKDLQLYRYVTRHEPVYENGIRTKLISIPWNVIEPGLHYLYEAVPNAHQYMIPPDFGYMHHYRRFFGCPANCVFIRRAIDTKAHFYAQDISIRVKNMVKKLEKECDIGDLRNKR
ncbi:hypothetical protein Fcan01_10288, partial [Folsomia candida]